MQRPVIFLDQQCRSKSQVSPPDSGTSNVHLRVEKGPTRICPLWGSWKKSSKSKGREWKQKWGSTDLSKRRTCLNSILWRTTALHSILHISSLVYNDDVANWKNWHWIVLEHKDRKVEYNIRYLTSLHMYSPYFPHTTHTGSPGAGYLCSLCDLTRSASVMLAKKVKKLISYPRSHNNFKWAFSAVINTWGLSKLCIIRLNFNAWQHGYSRWILFGRILKETELLKPQIFPLMQKNS